jgi:hypothetical protein
MAWVRTIEPQDADGETLRVYQEISGQERPQRIGNVLKSTSIRPRHLKAMMDLNNAVDFQNHDSGLSRLQLEMIASVVSTTLECRY